MYYKQQNPTIARLCFVLQGERESITTLRGILEVIKEIINNK
ncbi:MAG: hypothetical protein JWP37_1202 [Mucilaginibacter sp.]|nr:hypothetical protein [Mucilaginibacter sp.]